ncbi:BCNT-domain-containing protein [Aspergillus heteromorphus CBS 117.55]|uniref:SWR1-complex protein 5 n=1 Tax=Aspergillus heteromorphus CBS 117.55 TaxID=1448321 RepID=A0A317X0F0_9EURO|nr:BCNT-domain-containing protein [Aspergillus heteromorphus CBS 117.55]PWY89970.1 BCNT-domain-containing protein [Aspergillus heteromorphus CBS 117.55]
MPPDSSADLDLASDQYNSAEDSDFQIDEAAQDDAESAVSSDSDDDEEGAEGPATKRRKTGTKNKDENGEEGLDSGDEAMIQKANAKKKKKDEDDEEESGPGGFVRTRAMKMRGGEERKPLAKIDGATVDVDALWAKMNAPDGILPGKKDTDTTEGQNDVEMRDSSTPSGQGSQQSQPQPPKSHSPEMIRIKRTYKFAGEMITEEKIVAKDSAEAKLFLEGEKGSENTSTTIERVDLTTNANPLNLRRPLRKPSRFDPNPTGSIKKSWEKQVATETAGQENARGPKINTVEKSRLDWAAYVDQAGIKDELNVHSKAKEGFLGRMDFLDRVDSKVEAERRNARLKGL